MSDTNRHLIPQITVEVEQVTQHWSTEAYEPSTIQRMTRIARRFATRVAARSVSSLAAVSSDDCEEFVWSPTLRHRTPSIHTMHLRRTTLRALFSAGIRLGLVGSDPTLVLVIPPKSGRACRPLTPDELILVQLTALGRMQRPTRTASIVALAEATATTGELPRLTWNDIDLDDATVRLPGAIPVKPRAGRLSKWGVRHLGQLADLSGGVGDVPVVHRGASDPGSHTGQASMSRLLGRLLADAGLNDPDVKPTSIRLHQPALFLEEGGRVETAARMLGFVSLDSTADALGWEWTTT